MKSLSIIIPIYNTEQYLRRCIDSCLKQKDANDVEYEVICVNDGSTDNSGSILEEYQQACPSIVKIISQTNKGQSAARNAGMMISEGRYIWFVDSDDYIASNSLASIGQVIDTMNPDGIAIGYKTVYDQGAGVNKDILPPPHK